MKTYKHILQFIFMSIIALVIILIFPFKEVEASVTDNAKDFHDEIYKKQGQDVKQIGNDIYLLSTGTTASNNELKYASIGLRIKEDNTGNSVRVNSAFYTPFCTKVSEVVNGKETYVLFKISMDRLLEIDYFKDISLNGGTSRIFYVDMIMTVKHNGNPEGVVHGWGSSFYVDKEKPGVYTEFETISRVFPGDTNLISYFNKKVTIRVPASDIYFNAAAVRNHNNLFTNNIFDDGYYKEASRDICGVAKSIYWVREGNTHTLTSQFRTERGTIDHVYQILADPRTGIETYYAFEATANHQLAVDYIKPDGNAKISGVRAWNWDKNYSNPGGVYSSDMEIQLTGNGIFDIYTHAYGSGRWAVNGGFKDQAHNFGTWDRIGVDSTKPSISTWDLVDETLTNIKIKLTGINDLQDRYDGSGKEKGSGIATINVALFCLDEVDKDTVVWTCFSNPRLDSNGDIELTVPFDSKHDGMFGKKFACHIYIYDNVGNKTAVPIEFVRMDAAPQTMTDLQTWDYADPSNNDRWIRQGREAQIYTESLNWTAFSQYVGTYPSKVDTFGFSGRSYNDEVIDKLGKFKIFNYYYVYNDNPQIHRFNKNLYGSFEITEKSKPVQFIRNSRKGIRYTINLTPGEGTHGVSIKFTGRGATVVNTVAHYGKTCKEKDGEVLRIDGKPPEVEVTQVGRNSYKFSLKDEDSGLKELVIMDKNGKILDRHSFSSSEKETKGSKVVNLKGIDSIVYRAVDNVNNSITDPFTPTPTTIDSNITIDNDKIYESTSINGVADNPSKNANIKAQGVTLHGRKYLKAVYNANVVSGNFSRPTFTAYAEGKFVNQCTGGCLNNHGLGLPCIHIQYNKLEYKLYIDDKENTPDAPILAYTKDLQSVDWNKLEDVWNNYTFYIKSQFKGEETPTEEIRVSNVKFCSGYKDYSIKLWSVPGDGIMPTGDPLFNDRKDSLSFNMSSYPTGWYYMETTMYDYNDNPSGTGKLWFYHEQLARYDIGVGAVKDVDWEGLADIRYGIIGEPGCSNYFPLGKTWRANGTSLVNNGSGNPIAKGYAINWNLSNEELNQFNSIKVEYKCFTNTGKALTLYQEGKKLEQVDSSEGTTFTSESFDSSKLSSLTDNKLYLKHFLPVNFVAKTSDGKVYSDDITIRIYIKGVKNGSSLPVKSMDLYTIIQDETALDDVESDKKR